MSTTAPLDKQLRKIAILISSVDAEAAQQLLLQLPSETAVRVRALTNQLGVVSHEERSGILSEVRQLSASPNQSRIAAARDSQRSRERLPSPEGVGSGANFENREPSLPGTMVEPPDARPSSASQSTSDPRSNAWSELSVDGIVRVLRKERPLIIAVVISQLPAERAVVVLTQLSEISCDIMACLSRLKEIPPSIKQEIDEYLTTRLGEQAPEVESETESDERIRSLLDNAPTDLRIPWQRAVAQASGAIPERSKHTLDGPEHSPLHALGQSALRRRTESLPTSFPSGPAETNATTFAADSNPPAPLTHASDGVEIPESPRETEHSYASNLLDLERIDSLNYCMVSGDLMDTVPAAPCPPWQTAEHPSVGRSTQASARHPFEKLLELPRDQLAKLFQQSDSETVLLALAGASPEFMRRFQSMIESEDYRQLDARIKRLGPMKIRDIDEAQNRLVELSQALESQDDLAMRRAS